MPKITAHGGPSYAGLVDATPADVSEPEWVVPAPVVAKPAAAPAKPAVKPAVKKPAPRRKPTGK